MVTRSDELAESSSARYPGVWIQYKGDRARVLQTVEEYGRESLRAAIINEFMGDLEALSLAVPGQSMQDVRVVWGYVDSLYVLSMSLNSSNRQSVS